MPVDVPSRIFLQEVGYLGQDAKGGFFVRRAVESGDEQEANEPGHSLLGHARRALRGRSDRVRGVRWLAAV